MSLRERQKELTRELIVDALVEVITEQGPRTFAMEDVADRAGLSLRTLYRYYPGRAELLAALTERLNETLTLTEAQQQRASTLAGSIDLVRERSAFFSEHEKLARAALAILAMSEGVDTNLDDQPAMREAVQQRAERHRSIRDLIVAEFPGLPAGTVAQLAAVSRTLASLVGWGQMTGPAGGLDGDETGVAIAWALKTLLRRAREFEELGIERLEDDL